MMRHPDPDDVLRGFREREDVERATFEARILLRVAVEEELSFDKKLALIAAAAEPLLDGPGRDPLALYRAMNVIARQWRENEFATGPSPDERVQKWVEITLYRARGLHCGGDSRQAFNHCWAAHTPLENYAGGRESLLEKLGRDEPTLAAERMIRILGLLGATLKRSFPRGSPTREYWIGEIRAMVDAYIPGLDADRAMLYPGSPAMVQILYLLAENGDATDAKRINALRRLDERARLNDARAKATVRLRDIAIARFEGDDLTVAELSPVILESLKANDLWRHLHVVTDQGYVRR